MSELNDPTILSKIKDDENLSKFEAYVLEIQLAHAEYREVSKNVRTGWEYIVTLLRQFIITQLFLIISVAFFANVSWYAGTVSSSAADPGKYFSIPAIALMFFGSLFSLFVCFQSIRLFENSQEFVNRASAIEKEYSVGTLPVIDETYARSTFRYMEDRLRNLRPVVQMKTVLAISYAAAFILWLAVLLTYLFSRA